MKTLNLKQGKELVAVARKSIEYCMHTGRLLSQESDDELLNAKSGVFVTLHSYPSMDLRGCIGFPEPVMPLYKATIEAAASAALNDPRFPPLSFEELDSVVIEVSVLTKPEEIKFKKAEELKRKIKIGRHGLIAEKGFNRGLLLPQVPLEWNWNVEQFLENTCMKAGLAKDAWKEKGIKFYCFESVIFREKKPKGEVEKCK